uniref:GCM domain-containing protein n=1 Tax=Macrostomum lignano TaxID=282301 RepID=A0A1I8F775_9PLAT
ALGSSLSASLGSRGLKGSREKCLQAASSSCFLEQQEEQEQAQQLKQKQKLQTLCWTLTDAGTSTTPQLPTCRRQLPAVGRRSLPATPMEGRQDEAKRHTSGWAMRNTNNHNVSILKKSCLGVLVCRPRLSGPQRQPAGPAAAICDKARRNSAASRAQRQMRRHPGPSGLPGPLRLPGHAFLAPPERLRLFSSQGAHDHPAPDLKPAEDIRRRMRLLKKSGVPAVVQHQFAQQQQPIVKKAKKPQRQQQQPQHQQVQRQQQLIVKNAVKPQKQRQPKAKIKRRPTAPSTINHQQAHYQQHQHHQYYQSLICPYHRVDIDQCRCRPAPTAQRQASHLQQQLLHRPDSTG